VNPKNERLPEESKLSLLLTVVDFSLLKSNHPRKQLPSKQNTSSSSTSLFKCQGHLLPRWLSFLQLSQFSIPGVVMAVALAAKGPKLANLNLKTSHYK
jgi:hypothetical protein